jgi:hypothetical protein
MNIKQRENLAKYFYDLSKGLVLAVAIGFGTGKLNGQYAILDLFLAFYALWIGYVMEDCYDTD